MTARTSNLTWLGMALCALMTAFPASASVFNPHLIVSDDELRRFDAMDYGAIGLFLAKKGDLANRFDIDPMDGLLKNTTQLIDDAAKRYKVNPKYIIALIEKESSAVSAAKPTARQLDWATGYSLCDGCSRKTANAISHRGLAKQIDAGAGFIDWYFKNEETIKGLAHPGEPLSLKASKTAVTPFNAATAALYSYTPHLQGNRLLWSIWNQWFGGGTGSLEIPDGTLVRNEKTGGVALIQGGKFRPIVSKSVLTTRFNSRNVVDLNTYDFDLLQKAQMGRPVRFADLALVKTEDGAIWLLTGDVRRHIVSQEAFREIGFNPEEVEDASLEDIAEYATGDPIAGDDRYPSGALLQDKKSGGVYYVAAGIKHPLWDRAVLLANFPGRKPTAVTAEELAAIKDGPPVRLADGALARTVSDPAVYVISGGNKRAVTSAEAFEAYGYAWNNVLTVARKVLDLHPVGVPLTLDGGDATGVASPVAPADPSPAAVPVPVPASSGSVSAPTPVPASTGATRP